MLGLLVTPAIDCSSFPATYFRPPGGVLIAIAAEGSGFATDEEPDRWGTRLAPHRS